MLYNQDEHGLEHLHDLASVSGCRIWLMSESAGRVRVTSAHRSPRPRGADAWRRALSEIPTVFGRLVYLASLRDPVTGEYSHDLLSQAMNGEEADRTLRQAHHQVFFQWLTFNLADQKADLDEYFGENPLLSVAEYRDLAPRSARGVERQLYFSDLETLLELWKAERSAFPIPGA